MDVCHGMNHNGYARRVSSHDAGGKYLLTSLWNISAELLPSPAGQNLLNAALKRSITSNNYSALFALVLRPSSTILISNAQIYSTLTVFFYRLLHMKLHRSRVHCRVKSLPFSIAGESNRCYGPTVAFRVIVSEAVCADVEAACLTAICLLH